MDFYKKKGKSTMDLPLISLKEMFLLAGLAFLSGFFLAIAF